MRILYLSQYFPPEVGATQQRAYEMARHMVLAGHEVTLVTEVPNHPAGIIRPEYRLRGWTRESLEGIDVIRVWVWASPRKSFLNRVLFYGSFMAGATLAGAVLARGPFDLIYATSPPLLVGGAALALSRLRRTPLVFEARDLWPEAAVALGELRSERAIRWATRLEEACYVRARGIVVVTEGLRDRLLARGIPEEKLALIPNGSNVETFRFRQDGREEVRAALGAEDAFIVAFAGNHGLALDLQTIVAAAERLALDPGVRLLLVGEGPRKQTLRAIVESRGLTNVTLLPECPQERVPDYLSAADAVMIPLLGNDIFRMALPLKLFDGWSCERPVILGLEGESAQMMERVGGGIAVRPGDPAALVAAILRLRGEPDEARVMGQRGRKFVVNNHSRRMLAERLIAWLEPAEPGSENGICEGPTPVQPIW